jgi:hypothetical protein
MTTDKRRPRIWFYHDGRHPHIYRYEPPMRREEYVACIDELAGTPVEAVSFCLGEGRTVLHDTQVGELLGDNIDKWDHLIFRRAHQNARGLIDVVTTRTWRFAPEAMSTVTCRGSTVSTSRTTRCARSASPSSRRRCVSMTSTALGCS